MGTVTVINTTPYKLQPVPEVGKEYHAFDDGKIRPSRLEHVKIVEVIPFKECEDTRYSLPLQSCARLRNSLPQRMLGYLSLNCWLLLRMHRNP